MTPNASPICLYREAIHLQCLLRVQIPSSLIIHTLITSHTQAPIRCTSHHTTYPLTHSSKSYTYRSLPGKRSWALFHNSLLFAILGAYPVYQVFTICKKSKHNWVWSRRNHNRDSILLASNQRVHAHCRTTFSIQKASHT